ncbi:MULTISPECIES: hypothetical protein [unclassified Pseudomonas]|jgi:hypothetical protein|nr:MULTISPECIES: hypothetical protein [unclassified Pseudomonas]
MAAWRFTQDQEDHAYSTDAGFVFIDEWEPLASHPQILVQTMIWQASH